MYKYTDTCLTGERVPLVQWRIWRKMANDTTARKREQQRGREDEQHPKQTNGNNLNIVFSLLRNSYHTRAYNMLRMNIIHAMYYIEMTHMLISKLCCCTVYIHTYIHAHTQHSHTDSLARSLAHLLASFATIHVFARSLASWRSLQ